VGERGARLDEGEVDAHPRGGDRGEDPSGRGPPFVADLDDTTDRVVDGGGGGRIARGDHALQVKVGEQVGGAGSDRAGDANDLDTVDRLELLDQPVEEVGKARVRRCEEVADCGRRDHVVEHRSPRVTIHLVTPPEGASTDRR